MGGSVAVHVAAKKAIPKLAGLIVVDVVEVKLLLLLFLSSVFTYFVLPCFFLSRQRRL